MQAKQLTWCNSNGRKVEQRSWISNGGTVMVNSDGGAVMVEQ